MKILFTAFISVLFLSSCKKEVTELPPATQTGANTFGAMVDGKIWVPQGFGSIPSNNLLEARLLGNNLYIVAQNFLLPLQKLNLILQCMVLQVRQPIP
jgi:hypothetical protein